MLLWSLSVVMVSPLWSTSVSRRVWARRSLASPSPTVGCTYKMAREMGARDRGTRDRPLDRRSARSFFPPCGLLPLSVPTSVLWWFFLCPCVILGGAWHKGSQRNGPRPKDHTRRLQRVKEERSEEPTSLLSPLCPCTVVRDQREDSRGRVEEEGRLLLLW